LQPLLLALWWRPRQMLPSHPALQRKRREAHAVDELKQSQQQQRKKAAGAEQQTTMATTKCSVAAPTA
jgi:hypothetical protein